jgi:uncharacterized delta-60 repeat protein
MKNQRNHARHHVALILALVGLCGGTLMSLQGRPARAQVGTNPAAFTPTMAGSLDPTFGIGGMVTTSIGTESSAAAVAIQPDGKIVVAGTADSKFALARYNANGKLDSSFDGDGIATTDIGGAIASSVAIQADGKIVVAGRTDDKFVLARYDTNGMLDSSFDSDGIVTTPGADFYVSFTSVRLAVQADARIVICGSTLDPGTASYSTLIRYNVDGSLDTSFGNGGILRVDLSGIDYNGFNSVLIQSDGKILASGYDGWEVFGTTFSVARFISDGSFDSTFGRNGVVYDYLNDSFQGWVSSLAIAPDQKIVAAGTNYYNIAEPDSRNRFQINRYNPNGAHDLTFDGDGRVLTQFGDGSDSDANAVAIQPDGKIVVSGSSFILGSSRVAVSRYNMDGSLDSTYGVLGKVLIADAGSNGLTLDSSGRAVLAGYSNNSFCVIRLLGDGPIPTPTPGNPIDDAQFFIRQHYLDFLNREPDAGGLAYWTDRITQCGLDERCIHSRRIGVSAAFFIEQEFQDSGYYVYRFYKASFGRQPNYIEFTSDRGKVNDGSSLEVNKQAFAHEWVQRPAFTQAYPNTLSNTELVNKLFDSAGLTASIYDSQRQQEITAMNAGRSRALLLRDVIEIPDFKNIPDPNNPRYNELKQTSQYNPAFVLMQYFGYLRRNVDQAGYDFWLDVVNNREPNNYRGMVCAFITSAEYQLRFGAGVTRTNADCGQ